MLAGTNWDALGAIAGVIAVALVVGGAARKVVGDRIGRSRAGTRRIDFLEIRLFGLPPDPQTGAKKLDGEFDRIDKRIDEIPAKVVEALKHDG